MSSSNIDGAHSSATFKVRHMISGPSADPWGKQRLGLSAPTKNDRKHFGLTWNVPLQAGGISVGDEMTISLGVQLVKAERVSMSTQPLSPTQAHALQTIEMSCPVWHLDDRVGNTSVSNPAAHVASVTSSSLYRCLRLIDRAS